MSNLYARFKRIFPDAPMLVGTVSVAYTGGLTVDLPGGGNVNVVGEAAVGDHVFVRDGRVEGQAPALTAITIEI